VSDFECGSFRHDTVFYKAPERNCKFSGKRHDADFSTSHALIAETRVPPLGELAVDLFIYHFPTMQTGTDLPISHIFQEFRDWRSRSQENQ